MPLQRLTLELDADALPRVEALLRLAGAHSLGVSDAGDAPVFEPAPGETPEWSRVTLQALFAEEADLARIVRLIAEQSACGLRAVSIAPVADDDWIDAWRATIAPLRVSDRLIVVPAEDAPNELPRDRLAMHMGLAFGTGGHPTTRLCLDWLAHEIEGGETVLDFGCGSGILALAALRLGAGFALATDNDPQALAATERNARLNELAGRLWLGRPEELPEETADIVLANILAEPLIALESLFASLQREGGRIVLSGVLGRQAADVTAAYAADYGSLETFERDGWSRLTGTRRRVVRKDTRPRSRPGAGVPHSNG